jgi:hypothetical protein
LIKNNYPYVGYIYGGYEQIHRECKRFKIELDTHNEKKCFYCQNKNSSINYEIIINKKNEEEEKTMLYENLWEKKEKVKNDNLSVFIKNDPNHKIFLGILKEYKNEFIEQDEIQILISESFDKFQLCIYKFNNEMQSKDLENTLLILEKGISYFEENDKSLELTLLEKIKINNIISICRNPKNKNIVNISIKAEKGENALNILNTNKNNGLYNIVIDFSSDKISKNFIITFKSLINLYKSSKRKK